VSVDPHEALEQLAEVGRAITRRIASRALDTLSGSTDPEAEANAIRAAIWTEFDPRLATEAVDDIAADVAALIATYRRATVKR